jgi:general secretion pathway protein E
MAQRLVRKVCPECSEPLSNDKELIEKYKLQDYAQQFGFPEVTLRVGRGCSACAFSGYQGRVAIIEYLRIDDHVRALPKDTHFLQAAASHMRAADARSLYEDGLHKAMRGVTTLSEVVRVAG